MSRPPTLGEASERGLVAAQGEDVHTFSNGSEWEMWSEPNCERCKHFDKDAMGAACAFEACAFLHCVSPELATLFGWKQTTTEYGPRDGWEPPQTCAFFADRNTDDGDSKPRPTPHDPAQLVLLADPTEDFALAKLPKEEPVHA
jgi:hypothetical protein